MVHGRTRAPPRQTWHVPVDEGRLEVGLWWEAASFFLFSTKMAFSKRDAGVGVPVLSSLPRLPNSPLAKCGCKRHALDLYSDHTSTCTAHSHGRKHGTHSTRRDGKRRPAARRCGDSELPSGFIWTRRLLPLFACGSCTLCEGLSSCERGCVCMECVVGGGDI